MAFVLSGTFVAWSVFLTILVFALRKCRPIASADAPRLPYPPGPRRRPIIGNLLDIPRDDEANRYDQLAKVHGDLVYMKVLGVSILVVNTFEAANDLFEKRSSIYSDRNALPMINDLMGWDWSFGHMPYGDKWKAHRKMFHQHFQPSAVSQYWPIQSKEVTKLLRHLLDSPDDFVEHLRHNAASTIMNVIYGIEISETEEDFIAVAEVALDGMAKAANPGAFLVDVFPILKCVPSWFPLAGFKRKAMYWRQAVLQMRDGPYAFAKRSFMEGTASPCFVTYLLDELDARNVYGERREEEENKLRSCAGLGLAAGAESIVSSLSSFILAIVLHPEVQLEARAELDMVVGFDRLPEFSDRASAPYIDCIVKEVCRWNPVAPLGLPHMVSKNDEYRGYHIPSETTIIGNSWTILHDPVVFPNPSKFDPSRFREAGVRHDHVNVAFGYGRRTCPGRFMAQDQLWLSIASILSVFEIEQCEPTLPLFASGMISHPLPFRCTIKPRSHARNLIERLEL